MNRSRAFATTLAALAVLALAAACQAATDHADAAAASAPSAAPQGAADGLFQGFEPSGDWLLTIDGEPAPKARVYELQRAGALLILASQLPSPVLTDSPGRSVAVLDMMKVSERMDGTIDLLADAVLAPAGPLTIVNGKEAHFTVAGHDLVLTNAPWKLGHQKGSDLLDSNAGYRWRANRFEPDRGALERLRGEKREVRVLTFFGTWCPHCKANLPSLLKTEQRLGSSRIEFDYYGLPYGNFDDVEAKRMEIDSVPTAIVFVDGKEAGRIPARSWSNPDLALDLILHGGGASR